MVFREGEVTRPVGRCCWLEGRPEAAMAGVIDYASLIGESVAALQARESATRDKVVADRLRLLRLLKSGRVPSVCQAAALLGYNVRTVQDWWWRYRDGGLTALLPSGNPGGVAERITPAAWVALEEEMVAGRVGSLEAARVYLRDHWGLGYSIAGLSRLFQRRKTKLKTGRPRHRKAASREVQAAFKKGAAGDADAAQG